MMPLCGDFFMLILETKILTDAQGLFEDVCRVLLAVSGGADSVAMAHVLAELKKQGRLSCEFVVGHVNHCLRGAASDADEQFVIAFADSLGVPAVTHAVDVKAYAQEQKLSFETAGRVLRLKTLAQIATENNCDCIATAHHQDDLAETLVHRLMRGTGFRGLCGILPVSQVDGMKFIRPMLNVRRHEIVKFCKSNGLTWREDASNHNLNFTRNRIRHLLLPALNAHVAGTAHPTVDIVESLAELSHKSRQFSRRTAIQAQSILTQMQFDEANNEFAFKQDVVRECPPWVIYEVWRTVLTQLGVGLRDYTQSHFDAIGRMVQKEKAKAGFPGHLEIRVNKGVVIVQKKTAPVILPQDGVTLEIGKSVVFGPWRVSCRLLNREDADVERFFQTKDAFVEWFDADTIRGPIQIRARRDGDRFRPFGAKGEKKVGRFLIDAQLDGNMKRQAFIVSDAEKILWAAPVRMCEQAKITPETQNIVEIQLSELKQGNEANLYRNHPEQKRKS